VGGFKGGEFVAAVACQQMADDGCGQAFDQLQFFIAARMSEKAGFFALKPAPAGHAGPS
jgi:hypothetical protein